MNGFIDIHTHILPSVDDGANSVDDALELIGIAYQNGTREIVFTPHHRGNFKNYSSSIQVKFEDFKQLAQKAYPDMKFYLGQEIHYDSNITKLLYDKKLVTINDTYYCLIELGISFSRSKVLSVISEVISYGFVPIVAHIEHYDIFRKDKDIVDEVTNMGALIQINADSVMGKNGLGKKLYCKWLLKNGKVHFVASDSHDKNNRPPILNKCYKKVSSKYGTRYADKIFFTNQKQILQNKPL